MLSEKTAALPNSSGVLYTVAKEELKKFEVRSPRLNECSVVKHRFMILTLCVSVDVPAAGA